MFIEILKDSFKLLKKNSHLSQHIFIFLLIFSVAGSLLTGMKINIKIIPVALILFCFFCAFMAGLFFAFKKAIDYETDKPVSKGEFDLPPLYFAEFFQGTGRYFVKFLCAGIFMLIILLLVILCYRYVVYHYVVLPDKFLTLNYNEILSNDAKTLEFINGLSIAEQAKIGKIALFTFSLFSLFGVLTMFYPVLLVENDNNFLKSFLESLKTLLKQPLISIIIFFLFNVLISMSSFIYSGSGNNFFVAIVAILLQCYLNVWYILSLFVYYEKTK